MDHAQTPSFGIVIETSATEAVRAGQNVAFDANGSIVTVKLGVPVVGPGGLGIDATPQPPSALDVAQERWGVAMLILNERPRPSYPATDGPHGA